MINKVMKNRVTTPGLTAMNRRKACEHCGKETTLGNIKIHEATCYLNPDNLVECPVCSEPIKNYKTSKTCGYSCSNTKFRSGVNNPNHKIEKYRTVCFHYHDKKCLVCGEDKIVTVHHVNEDHHDNRPENLVPLCPTHHQYVHSRYKDEVQPLIERYVEKFISQ